MKRMTDRQASNYLQNEYGIKRTELTLRKYRTVGGGPKFRKAGRSVLYDVEALDEWAMDLLSEPIACTAEATV